MKNFLVSILLVCSSICYSQTIFEAENYTTLSGVRTETTTDAGGGKSIGYVDRGDWMEYNIPFVTGGYFILQIRVASPYTGSKIDVHIGGLLQTSIEVPNTGGWQKWISISDTVQFSQGVNKLRFTCNTSRCWNVNWFSVKGLTSTPPSIITWADSSFFPSRYLIHSTVSDIDGIASTKWEVLSGAATIIWADSTTAKVQPYQVGETVFRLTAIDKKGNSAIKNLVVNTIFEPWRVNVRTSLGELGELIILSNGEYLFSGPCKWFNK